LKRRKREGKEENNKGGEDGGERIRDEKEKERQQ
jgi:hypothetical protein